MTGKRLIALSLAALVLLMSAMTAAPQLHELMHHDCDSPQHICAVTLFLHGQVDAAVVAIEVPLPAFEMQADVVAAFNSFAPAIENLPAGRAPPFAV